MKIKKFEIELMSENSVVSRTEAFEKVFRYLLQKYYEGCEESECFGIFESINRGTGRKGVFNASPENGRNK